MTDIITLKKHDWGRYNGFKWNWKQSSSEKKSFRVAPIEFLLVNHSSGKYLHIPICRFFLDFPFLFLFFPKIKVVRGEVMGKNLSKSNLILYLFHIYAKTRR